MGRKAVKLMGFRLRLPVIPAEYVNKGRGHWFQACAALVVGQTHPAEFWGNALIKQK